MHRTSPSSLVFPQTMGPHFCDSTFCTTKMAGPGITGTRGRRAVTRPCFRTKGRGWGGAPCGCWALSPPQHPVTHPAFV